MVITFGRSRSPDIFLQLSNAYAPIDVTLSRLISPVNPVQPWNAYVPIEFTFGAVNPVNPSHCPIDIR